ncbi:MAG: CsgG/HfaB family protein [Nitrospinaceae bacterium]
MIQPVKSDPAQVGYKSAVHDDLVSLPPPNIKIVVGVYKFRDQTGQYKSGTPVVTYSTAVTQGATSMLIKALEDAGRGRWFSVLERESLPNLLNERKIIRQTRKQYLSKDDQRKIEPLPPLLYAPIMLDGGIVAFETNLLTGGVGARYFGAGGSTQFRRDTVTIYLRAVSVKNGQIIKSVLTNKTIFSMEVDAGLFRFVSFKRLLEVEAGLSTNEPPQMAVLESIEKAVYSMLIEGVIDGLWSFKDPKAGVPFIKNYLEDKDPNLVPEFDQTGNVLRVSLRQDKEANVASAAPSPKSTPPPAPAPQPVLKAAPPAPAPVAPPPAPKVPVEGKVQDRPPSNASQGFGP